MNLTEYAKEHKYIFIYADYNGGYCDGWKINKNLYKIEDCKWPNIRNIRIFGAELEEKPKLDFKIINELIYNIFGYGYIKIEDVNIIEKITENQTALDIINNILAEHLIQFPSYIQTEDLIEPTEEEFEDYFNIYKALK